MEMYLRCAVHDSPRKWRRWLPMAEFWYNSTFHSSLNCTPFKALYGKEANLGAMPAWPEEEHAGDDMDWSHTENIRAQLERAQHRFKKQADRNRTERQFQVGEQVLLKLQPYAQRSVVSHPCAKLAFKFYGPYTVLEKIDLMAYKLGLPPASKVHPVFHVSQLKLFTSDYTPVYTELPHVPDLSMSSEAPTHLLERRMMKRVNAAIMQVKVQWGAGSPPAITWEDYEVLRQCFTSAAIWDDAEASTQDEAQS
uniref:Tf2-1-like SH3-like domain-containing protein n=1 Tax=Triticum urartu TaxID=4572 RepID=A0A8R7VJB4_TRIUA